MGNNMWKDALQSTVKARYRVQSVLDKGHVSDEDLFALLTDEDSQVKWAAERELNSAPAGSPLAKRVDEFVVFLRGRLGCEAEGLPDAWVVKTFGFNLVTDEGQRKPVFIVVDEYASLLRGKTTDAWKQLAHYDF